MTQHRFKVGDRVHISGSASASQGEIFMDAIAHTQPGGIFEVTAHLPEIHGEAQYRIKGGDDGSERVVRESQIAAAERSLRP